MSVLETLLCETLRLMRIDTKGADSLLCALNNCKCSGIVGAMEVRAFANYGFPLIQIYATIKGIPTNEAAEIFKSNRVTYEDLVCIIGIFAQDIKLRSQYGR